MSVRYCTTGVRNLKQGFKECGKNRISEAMAGEKRRNEEGKKRHQQGKKGNQVNQMSVKHSRDGQLVHEMWKLS